MTTEKLAEAKRLEGIIGVHKGQFSAIKERLTMVDEIEKIESIEESMNGKSDKWQGAVSIDKLHFTPAFARGIYEQMLDYCARTASEAEAALKAL